jgi:hypothetical protein
MRRWLILCALAFGLGASIPSAMAGGHGGSGPAAHFQLEVWRDTLPSLQLHLQLPDAPSAEIFAPQHAQHSNAHAWAEQVADVVLPRLQQLPTALVVQLRAELAFAKAREEALCAFSNTRVSDLNRRDYHAEFTQRLHPPSPPLLSALPLLLALLAMGLLARRRSQAHHPAA